MIVGVDEVGRGAWAGPLLVVAARPKTNLPSGLADSKALSKKRRGELFELLTEVCDFGEGWVQPEEIDNHGLAKAMRLGVSRALIMLAAELDQEIIMDGKINYCPPEYSDVSCVIGADASHPVVSAASVYAKVLRDRHMRRLALLYPKYGFEKHVGYGTHFHQLMLRVYGASRIHRKSYKPVKQLMIAIN